MATVIGNPTCELCPLHRTAQFVCLMGRGAVPARVMVVGEAPGKREDDTGKPFQGPAGKLLDVALEKAGLDRSKIYITNAVKCRPPENRTPKGKEMKACHPYLQKEIEEVRPKFVLLLGAVALKAVLGGKPKITEMHGQPIVKDRVTYFPAFHPAAALRDPSRVKPLEDDILKFAQMTRGEYVERKDDVPYTLVDTHELVREMLADIYQSHVTSFDTETTGLDRFERHAQINILGLSTDRNNWVIPLHKWGRHKSKNIVIAIADKLRRPRFKRQVVAQNGKFDNLWLMEMFGVDFPLTFDTMLAAHVLDENESTSLKYQAPKRLGVPSWDISLEAKKGIGPETYQYNARDCKYTRDLYFNMRAELEADEALWNLFIWLVMPSVRAYTQIERNGVFVDVERLDEAGEVLAKNVAESKAKLQKMSKAHINWGSTKQLNRVLFEKMGLPVIGLTPGGDPSTSEGNLLRMKHPIAKELLKYRENLTLLNTFINGWRQRLRGSYLFPSFKMSGTVTGRPSCEDPNLQQTPRDKRVRSLVGAPDGWVFFEADYSQIELRIAAVVSQDTEMMRIFQTGGDIHRETGSAASGIPADELTDEDRKKAKAVNFGFLYGMGWKKFIDYAFEKYDSIFSIGDAKEFRTRFFEKYYCLEDWHNRQRRIVRACGQVRTFTGRLRRLPGIYSPDKKFSSEAERAAINSPVQGFAAELTLMAMVEISRRFGPDVLQLCGTVHDAIVGRVRADVAREVLAEVKRIMMSPALLVKFGIELNVPILVEVKVGNWSVGKKLEV